jgi:predicted Zn-dependent protease
MALYLLPFHGLSFDNQGKAKGALAASVRTEKDLGREFHKEAKRRFTFVKNHEVIEYISRIGQKIASASGSAPYTFRFFVINNSQINAFAVPGGYIYLHSGLILKTRDAHELASVVAHELAHVKERHMSRQMKKSTPLNLATLAAIFLSRGAPAVATGAAAISQTLQLKYSREFEREADRFGTLYMYQAGYGPEGMISFFETLLKEQQIFASSLPPYLHTHPLTIERINAIDSLIHSQRLQRKERAPEDDFHRIQVLVTAEAGRQEEVLSIYKQRVEKDAGNPIHYYDLGLVYRHYGQFNEAIDAQQKALELAPQDVRFQRDLASLFIQLDHLNEAEALLEKAEQLTPESPVVFGQKGDLLMKKGKADEAIAAYKKALLSDPYSTRNYYNLGLAYSKKEDKGEYHFNMGLYYLGIGEDKKAIDHLESARREFGSSSPKGRLIQERIEAIKKS